jgi:phosphoglycolate phosphatase
MSLIIFDFDGVLADTLLDLLQFGQEACDKLGIKHIVRKDDLSSLEVMSFTSYGQACGVPDQLLDEFVRICLKRIAEKKFPPAIFKGLSKVVRRLAANNTLAVITTNSSQNVNAFLVDHGLDGYIRAVYGVDSPGSKAQKISASREMLSAERKREPVFMVGDSLSDIRAAKEASVISVVVTWGHQSLSHLLTASPDYVAYSPNDLIEIIEK